MGAFWAGSERPCVHASPEKSPRSLADMCSVRICGEAGLACSQQAVAGA